MQDPLGRVHTRVPWRHTPKAPGAGGAARSEWPKARRWPRDSGSFRPLLDVAVPDDHNPRTPRQLPAELRLGVARRGPGSRLRLAVLAGLGAAGVWLATYGIPLHR